MNDCLFCAIANGPQKMLVWSSDDVAAFRDIHPKAPVHLLVVPKQHVTNLDDLDDPWLGGRLLAAVKTVAAQEGIAGAYRVSIHNGRAAGQIVDHLHLHVLGG
jgi:histidine triad (HIT) family protein